jgi:hypothetical protein
MLGNLAATNGQEPDVRYLAAKAFISEQLADAQQLPSDWAITLPCLDVLDFSRS